MKHEKYLIVFLITKYNLANDKTFTIIIGAYNNLEQVAIGLGSEGIGAVSKLGMFAVAAKTATAAKAIAQQTAKLGRNAARFFGGKELLTPEQQLTKALQESKVYEILENIHSNSPNAAAALRGKLSGLKGAQLSADITREMPSGAIRYYDKFRPSRTAGPSSGSRFVTDRSRGEYVIAKCGTR